MVIKSQTILIIVLVFLLFYINLQSGNTIQKQDTPAINNLLTNISNTTANSTYMTNSSENLSKVNQFQQTPQQPTDITKTILNLGATVWPSQPLGGWVVIILVLYFLILPLLKFIKGLTGF